MLLWASVDGLFVYQHGRHESQLSKAVVVVVVVLNKIFMMPY